MNEAIEISTDRIKEIIQDMNSEQFSTADVLRHYSGSFHSNVGTPAYYSLNAQFGKLLKRNCDILQIEEIESDVPLPDDNGHMTKASMWQKS